MHSNLKYSTMAYLELPLAHAQAAQEAPGPTELESWGRRLRQKAYECRRMAADAALEWASELESIADECDREAEQIELLLNAPSEGYC
jgi:hypothetical protein